MFAPYLVQVLELLELLHDTLNSLFRKSFKEGRMIHFFKLVGSAITGYVQQVSQAELDLVCESGLRL